MDKEESPFACEFDGNAVQSGFGLPVTEESCQKIYKVVMQGTTIYSDDLQPMIDQRFSQYYQGPGEWDEASSMCKYEENIVTDMEQNPIKEREKCGKVYNYRGLYVSITPYNVFEIMGMPAQSEYAGEGTWKEAYGKTGIYEAEDEDGTSYYYRGAVTNNYVEFAGFYWRIIRINGNGSIRLLYSGIKNEIDDIGKGNILKNGYDDGDTQYTEIELSDGTKIGPFNKFSDDNAYVGFRYGTAQSETYEKTHANDNDSNAKYELDEWFKKNLLSVQEKLDVDAGFCGDRSIAEGSGEGIGKSVTNYKGYERYVSAEPILKCPNINHDYYTAKGAKKGNQE